MFHVIPGTVETDRRAGAFAIGRPFRRVASGRILDGRFLSRVDLGFVALDDVSWGLMGKWPRGVFGLARVIPRSGAPVAHFTATLVDRSRASTMGITFTRLFNRLFSKKEIRILMVRAPLAVDATAFFFRRRAPSSQIHRLIAKPRAFSISAGWSRCRR